MLLPKGLVMQDAAIALVEDPNRKHYFLWVKRRDLPIWVLPGGGIDSSESPEMAVIREVEEESGLVVKVERKAAQYTPINRWTRLTHVFICCLVDGKPRISDESVEIGFFSVQSPPYPCFPLHVIWMEEALTSSKEIIRPLNDLNWLKVALFFFKHPFIFLKYLHSRLF